MSGFEPTLYYRADCPFCWKVRIVLAELSINYRHVELVLGEQHPDVLRFSPKGSVPVLVDADGVVWESAVIVEYLLDRSQASDLLPNTAVKRSAVRLLQSYSDTIVGPALRGQVFEKRSKPKEDWSEEVIQKSQIAWVNCQIELAQRLGNNDYFCEQFSIAECALLPRFAIAAFYGSPIPNELQDLRRWFDLGVRRPSFLATYPKIFSED